MLLSYLDIVLGGGSCVFAALWVVTLISNRSLSAKLALIISNYKADLELVTIALMNTNRALGVTTEGEQSEENNELGPSVPTPLSAYT